jgi:hypothetical protein
MPDPLVRADDAADDNGSSAYEVIGLLKNSSMLPTWYSPVISGAGAQNHSNKNAELCFNGGRLPA